MKEAGEERKVVRRVPVPVYSFVLLLVYFLCIYHFSFKFNFGANVYSERLLIGL